MTKNPKRIHKFIFTLNNIDINAVLSKYNIPLACDSANLIPTNVTKLSDLNTDKNTTEVISFLDESKKMHLCHVCMIDFTTQEDVNTLKYNCYWCRHKFETKPIGCPIRYVSSQAIKNYISNINKDMYTIKENITSLRRDKLDTNMKLKEGEYYETDGVFCSFNCCQAFIDDNKRDHMYDNSSMLLAKMYNNLMSTRAVLINPAPHWRLLTEYGGIIDIKKFRENFNKVEYEYHGITKSSCKFKPIGVMYEEKIKF
uniref:Uncharacterized protein n=1 Tax=viral metagenome TaxID=1070528 RepID=A0A6C0CZ02_9ZZZZ